MKSQTTSSSRKKQHVTKLQLFAWFCLAIVVYALWLPNLNPGHKAVQKVLEISA